jgi:hypothetical protein
MEQYREKLAQLGLPLSTKKKDKPTLEFMQKYMLPALESCAALYLAASDDGSTHNQKKRFVARTILSLSRTCQDLLGHEKRTAKFTTGVFILVQIIYAGYQLLDDGSDFGTWLVRKRANEQRLPHPIPRPYMVWDDVPVQPEPGRVSRQEPLNDEQKAAARAERLAALRQRGIRV